MSIWILTCPSCGTANEVSKNIVIVKCGVVSCTCTCLNCNEEFRGEQAYWRWLGLDEEPPAGDKVDRNT